MSNTLAYIDVERYRMAKKTMAEMANVPEALFFELWRQYSRANNRGDILTVEERVVRMLRDLGITPEREFIHKIADIEYKLQEREVELGPMTKEVLSTLKQKGLKLGLVTNTGYSTTRVPELLGLTPFFDAIVLSYVVRSLKPGALIYQIACDKLGVPPHACLFVGDGDDGEIEGALNVGMRTVLLKEQREKIAHTKVIPRFDYLIERLDEVIGIVEKLLQAENR